ALMLVAAVVGGVGLSITTRQIDQSVYDMHLDSSADYGRRFASAIESQLAMGVEQDQVFRYLQHSFASTPAVQGRYLCLMSDKGEVLCHPKAGNVGLDAARFPLISGSRELDFQTWLG